MKPLTRNLVAAIVVGFFVALLIHPTPKQAFIMGLLLGALAGILDVIEENKGGKDDA